MSHSKLTDAFITNYLNQLEYNDFASIGCYVTHMVRYASDVFIKNDNLIYDSMNKLSSDKRDQFIKKVMHLANKIM